MRYNVIVLVEALVSLCAHIAVEAMGITPRTYRDAVRLGVKCVKDLEALVSPRNILIHRYWTVSDERVRSDFRCVEELISKIVEFA